MIDKGLKMGIRVLFSVLRLFFPLLLAFLADKRGFNLRNRLSHGMMGIDDFNEMISDRVIHALLLLSKLEIDSKEPQDGE